MKPIRILYDFEVFSDQTRGGISRYIFEIADHLARTGQAEVKIAAGIHRNRLLLENPRPWITGRYFPAFRFTGEIRRRLNARLNQREIAKFGPDVVHRTIHRHVADYCGSHKTVATIHDLTQFIHPEFFPDAEIVRARLREVARTADHLLCDSENTRKDAARILGAPESRMTVVPLGVHVGRAGDARPANGNFFLFVGQRGGYKNFPALLKAVATTPALAYTRVVSFGGVPFTSQERQLIDSLQLASRVAQTEGDDTALADHYAAALALVYPSFYEGFGLPVLEAMAHGCPVACSRTSSLPEVGGDAALYFDPRDTADIATTLVHLAGDRGLRARLAESGRTRASGFTWAACAERTMSVYRAVAYGVS